MKKPGPKKSFSELKKIMEDASKRGKKLPRKAKRPRLGTRGTNWAEAKMSRIKKIAEGSGPNNFEAHKILNVFLEAYKGNISPPAADHQVLANTANKIIRAEKKGEGTRLTQRQSQTLEKYFRMV